MAAKSEHYEQTLFVSRVRAFYPDLVFFAIPNGGLRDKRVAIKLKEEGVVAGVPDLLVPEPRFPYHGLFVEMKRRGRQTWSSDQRKMRDRLRERGYRVELANGADEALEILESYLKRKSWLDKTSALCAKCRGFVRRSSRKT